MPKTYKDIAQVNKDMTFKAIKGKKYAEVKERVNAFRKLYPSGFIRTEIVQMDEKLVLMKAVVGYYEECKEDSIEGKIYTTSFPEIILGTGHAYEFIAKNKNINSTSMIENCETSAVGRALAMCGIGIDVSIASYEEMNAVVFEDAKEKTVKPIPETDEARKAAAEEFLGYCNKNNLSAALAGKHFGLSGKPSGQKFAEALDDLKSMVELNTIPDDWRLKG